MLAADEAGEAAAARGHKRRKRRRPALEDGHAGARRCPLIIVSPEPAAIPTTKTAAPSQNHGQRQPEYHHHTSGPKAALVLSEWLGNALVCPSSPSPHRDSHVSLLGLLLHAEAALPRHTALIVACLEQSSDRRVRLEAVGALAGMMLDSVKDYLPVLAARLVSDPCAKVRLAVLTTLSGPFVMLSQPHVHLVLASLEDVSAPVHRAATKALVQMGDAGLLTPQDIDTLGQNLLSRSSAVREGSMQVLCALLYLTRTCFRAKRLLEAPLWEQHDTVASLAVAREACPAVRVLGLQFLADLPRHLCAQHVSIVVQRLEDPRLEAREAALTFLQRNLDPELLRRHVPALLQLLRPSRPRSSSSSSTSSSSSSFPSSSSARCELAVLKCLHLVPERALEPFVTDIVAAVQAVKEDEDEEVGLDKQQQRQQQPYVGSVQSAAVDVLGRMRTAVVLPLLETTLMVWVFGCLSSPSPPHSPLPSVGALDSVVVAHAMSKLQRVRNAEVKQACLARLVACLREGGGEGNQARVLILMLLAKLGPRVVHTHAASIVSVLHKPRSAPRVRHEALKTLLVLPLAQLSTHVRAIVIAMLCSSSGTGKEGEEEEEEEKDHKEAARWKAAALEVLRHREKDKVALVYKAVKEAAAEEDGEEGEEEEEEEDDRESDKENEGETCNQRGLKKQEEKEKNGVNTKEARALLLEALAAAIAPVLPTKVVGVEEEEGREEAATKTSARRTRRRSPRKTRL